MDFCLCWFWIAIASKLVPTILVIQKNVLVNIFMETHVKPNCFSSSWGTDIKSLDDIGGKSTEVVQGDFYSETAGRL